MLTVNSKTKNIVLALMSGTVSEAVDARTGYWRAMQVYNSESETVYNAVYNAGAGAMRAIPPQHPAIDKFLKNLGPQ